MASIFSKIISKEIPGYIIAEDQDYIAFLDVFPLVVGHVLVVPKKEVDYIFGLDTDTYIGLQVFAKRIALAIDKAIPCKRVGVAVIGLEVPHAHIHLVPLQSVKDINFTQPKIKVTEEVMEQTMKAIQQALV